MGDFIEIIKYTILREFIEIINYTIHREFIEIINYTIHGGFYRNYKLHNTWGLL